MHVSCLRLRLVSNFDLQETDYHTQTRPSSAIHIRLYKKAAPHAAAVGDETTAAPPKQKT